MFWVCSALDSPSLYQAPVTIGVGSTSSSPTPLGTHHAACNPPAPAWAPLPPSPHGTPLCLSANGNQCIDYNEFKTLIASLDVRTPRAAPTPPPPTPTPGRWVLGAGCLLRLPCGASFPSLPLCLSASLPLYLFLHPLPDPKKTKTKLIHARSHSLTLTPSTPLRPIPSPNLGVQAWKETFRKHDADMSGSIEHHELQGVFVALGYNMSPAATDTCIKRYS